MNTLARKLQDRVVHTKLWTVPIALSVALFCVMVMIGSVDYTLTSFPKRAIGISILSGIDAGERSHVYWLAIAAFALICLIAILLLGRLERRDAEDGLADRFIGERDLSFALALLLLVNLLLDFRSAFSARSFVKSPLIFVPLVLLFLIALHVLMKRHVLLRLNDAAIPGEDAIAAPEFLAVTLLAPLPVVYFIAILFACDGLIDIVSVAGIIGHILIFLVSWVVFRKLDWRRLCHAIVPVFSIPVVPCVANEIQYTLTRWTVFSPKLIAVLLCVLLIASSCIIYFRSHGLKDPSHLLESRIFPIVLVAFGVVINYASVTASSTLDMLHLGNVIVPAQQLIEYGQIPLLDYWGPQLLPIGGILYSLVNGFNALDLILWIHPVNAVLFVLLFYFVLKKIVPSQWLFLATLFLPFLALSNTYYLGALLPLLYLPVLIKKRRQVDYILFLLLSLCSFIWMSSMGKASILASVIMLLCLGINKDNLKKIVVAGCVSFGLPVLLYCLLALARGYDIPGRLTLISAFSSCDFDIGSYTSIFNANCSTLEITVLYGVMPILTFILAVYLVVKRERNGLTYTVLFIAIAALVISERTLARHCLGELGYLSNQCSGFYALLLLLSPFVLPCPAKEDTYIRQIVFSALALFLLLAFPHTADPGNGYTPLGEGLVNGVKDISLHQFQKGETRITSPEPSDFIGFIDSNLSGDQTFFDASNAHLLYALTDKKAPFLHHSVQIIQTDPAQKEYVKEFQKKYDEGEIPVVVMGNDRGYIDGIPNELSIFRVSEFIYRNYTPYKTIDGYLAWIANNSSLKEKLAAEDGTTGYVPMNYPQDFSTDELPYIWGSYDSKATEIEGNVEKTLASDLAVDTQVELNFDSGYDKTNGNYLYMEIDLPGDAAQTLTVSYGANHQDQISMTVLPGDRRYLVRVSSQYDWVHDTIGEMQISTSAPVDIKTISINEGD